MKSKPRDETVTHYVQSMTVCLPACMQVTLAVAGLTAKRRLLLSGESSTGWPLP